MNEAIHEINTIIDCQIQDLEEWGDDQPVRIGGLIRSCKKLRSKRGDPMAFLAIEDLVEAVEVIVFPNTYAECEEILSSVDPIIIQGTVQKDERGPKIIAEAIDSLQDAREKYTDSAKIKLKTEKLSRQKLEKVKKTLYQFHGSCPVNLTLHFADRGDVDIEVLKDLTIRPCRGLTDTMEEILEYKAISFSKKPIIVKPRKKRWENKAKAS